MREQRIKPKIPQRTAIPGWLVKFFRNVDKKIRRRDYSAITASDDFLQDNGVVGGLVEEGGSEYYFTAFPGPDNPINDPKWELTLSTELIRHIASGGVTHFDLWGCSNPDCHSLFSTPEGTCFYCDYEDDERDERDKITLDLLNRRYSRKEDWVRAYLEHFPDDHYMLVIGQYNQSGLGEKLGWFSGNDMKAIIQEYNDSQTR